MLIGGITSVYVPFISPQSHERRQEVLKRRGHEQGELDVSNTGVFMPYIYYDHVNYVHILVTAWKLLNIYISIQYMIVIICIVNKTQLKSKSMWKNLDKTLKED